MSIKGTLSIDEMKKEQTKPIAIKFAKAINLM